MYLVPLDVDGDGVSEAMVVPAIVRNGTGVGVGVGSVPDEWGLRVLDLKPMHVRRGAEAELAAFPFRPRAMFESAPGGGAAAADDAGDRYLSRGAVPIKMTTGQIVLSDRPSSPERRRGRKKYSKEEFVESDDRTRHFFCGKDWGDAAERCSVPCPKGNSQECPEGEQCFA